MSVYRIHEGGTGRGRKVFFSQIKLIETLCIFNCLSEFKYDELIKKRLDDIRSGILDHARAIYSDHAIINMSWWEKVLTYRYYILVIRYLVRKLKRE